MVLQKRNEASNACWFECCLCLLLGFLVFILSMYAMFNIARCNSKLTKSALSVELGIVYRHVQGSLN